MSRRMQTSLEASFPVTPQCDFDGRELKIGDEVEVITPDFPANQGSHQIAQGTVVTLVGFDATSEMFEVESGMQAARFKASELRRLDQH